MKFDSAHDTAVFLGPSLDRSTAARILPANYYPPVRMGDVYMLNGSGVKRIVILDGVFFSTASVWHREILDALWNGIEVIGGASMGALRAAELHLHGMIGHGTIFEWYRDGVLDGDDEVALLHGDEAAGFQPASVPLVNMRATLDAAEELSAAQREEIIASLKRRCFADRAWPPLHREFPSTARIVPVDLKRRDAIGVLEHCAATAPAVPPAADPRLPAVPRGAYARARAMRRGFLAPSGRLVAGETILDVVARDEARLRALREEATLHCILLDWARTAGIAPRPVDGNARSVEWLRGNGISEREYRSALEDEGRVAAVSEQTDPLASWIRHRGIAPPAGDLRRWLVERDPPDLGFALWSLEEAILMRLRTRGEIADLLREIEG